MNKSPSPSKKCTICGIERPMTAFLILKTQVGAQYGNVCADCRQKKFKEAPALTQDAEEERGTVNRHTIDNKAKVAIEIEKQKRLKEVERRDFEDTNEAEEEKSLKLEKNIAAKIEEKKHREKFLHTLIASPLTQKVEEKKAVQRIHEQTIKQQTEQHAKEHEKIQQEAHEIGFTNPLLGPTDKLKHQSTAFRQFLSWVGEGSAIAKNLSHLQKTHTSLNQESVESEPTIEDLTNYINKPSSRKK